METTFLLHRPLLSLQEEEIQNYFPLSFRGPSHPTVTVRSGQRASREQLWPSLCSPGLLPDETGTMASFGVSMSLGARPNRMCFIDK